MLVSLDRFPSTLAYILFFNIIAKLYTNSVLAILNSRNSLRGNSTGGMAIRGPTQFTDFAASSSARETYPKTVTSHASICAD